MFGTTSETKKNLLAELNLPTDLASVFLDRLNSADHRYIKDLKINVSNSLKASTLSEKDAVLLALGVAINEKSSLLVASLEELAKAKGVEEKELLEVASCVSLMNANNVFYRFRHFMDKESYNNIPAGIRMSIMMNPVLGKEFFELLSLVISAINGCEMCVTSHEASVKSHGASEQRIFEAVRLGAILKSFIVLL
ncbi:MULTISPECIES: carboxymuconolactone decarboxylase family protein [Flectobacillus]|uniref:carboxymuconolactone decarboxylase family protein n=1 Tax=Flectobacillus TaxID=101 RepID=UPI000BA33FDC|nr:MULTISPECIES: carboxymuconolactone decarboxylase family protein [Flectobacillus]MDI9871608.1 carboxymuconolactone decarboxylase family protein [Flectobacillus roseus]NBA75766.1 alkylhydroperoxidase [Emticicia sp. ODNR4P]PAC29821.1 alkylhydroperoxidase [Flectobacillus sp. BAB-3569]